VWPRGDARIKSDLASLLFSPQRQRRAGKPTAGNSKKNVYLSLVPEYLSDAGHWLRDCEVTGLNTARMISLSV
jgi:hypothetical protein